MSVEPTEAQIAQWTAERGERKSDGAARRAQATADFPAAQRLAQEKGMKLTRLSEQQYKLRAGRLFADLYPGNCRIFSPPGPVGWPFLGLGGVKWTLAQVIEASAKALAKQSSEQATDLPAPYGRCMNCGQPVGEAAARASIDLCLVCATGEAAALEI